MCVMEAYDLFGRTLSVTEANDLIHRTVDELFYELRIEGEISGFRPASSGHWYFTLKDSGAAIDAAVFRSAQYSMMMPENGDLVTAKGSLSYYTRTGKLTFVIREMKKKGDGALMEMIEKRKEYYRSLGYFDEDRKKPIPEEISRLGVVTSPTGAAIRDILSITKRRAPSLDIIIFPAAVQGEGAAESIARRIRQADLFAACDVLIVGRGGGSAEDLSCFSEPAVIEAIHASSIPVISAVGHEIDWTKSDLAADRRAPTPSAAAEIVTETIFRRRERLGKASVLASSLMKERLSLRSSEVSECLHALSAFEKRILRYSGRIPSVSDLRRMLILRLQNAETRLGYTEEDAAESIGRTLTGADSRLHDAVLGTEAGLRKKMEEASAALRSLMKEASALMGMKLGAGTLAAESAIKEAEALSPLSVLRRGYSVTYGRDGKILKNREDAAPGDMITTRLMDGMIASIVKEG